MKKLLLFLLLLPALAIAQQETEQPTQPKNEILLANGISIYPFWSPYIEPVTTYLMFGYMHNYEKWQLGFRVEGGSEFRQYWYASPMLVINKTFPVKRGYLYAGSAAGYHHHNNFGSWVDAPQKMNGYVLGAQGGVSLNIDKHFSFSAEAGVRTAQVWYPNYYNINYPNYEPYFQRYIAREFMLSIPVTLGFKYRF